MTDVVVLVCLLGAIVALSVLIGLILEWSVSDIGRQ